MIQLEFDFVKELDSQYLDLLENNGGVSSGIPSDVWDKVWISNAASNDPSKPFD